MREMCTQDSVKNYMSAKAAHPIGPRAWSHHKFHRYGVGEGAAFLYIWPLVVLTLLFVAAGAVAVVVVPCS